MTDWIERNRGYILVVLINLAVVGALHFWLQRPAPEPLEILPPPAPSPALAPTVAPPSLRVHVTGAVLHPDVYRLPAASIVTDALEAAGGAATDADLTRINLAQELRDQQQVYVPRIGERDVPPATPLRRQGTTADADRPAAPTAGININTATAAELDVLPGIGPLLSQQIVDWREAHGPFATIADIKQVPGIGDAIFERIKDRITVG